MVSKYAISRIYYVNKSSADISDQLLSIVARLVDNESKAERFYRLQPINRGPPRHVDMNWVTELVPLMTQIGIRQV